MDTLMAMILDLTQKVYAADAQQTGGLPHIWHLPPHITLTEGGPDYRPPLLGSQMSQWRWEWGSSRSCGNFPWLRRDLQMTTLPVMWSSPPSQKEDLSDQGWTEWVYHHSSQTHYLAPWRTVHISWKAISLWGFNCAWHLSWKGYLIIMHVIRGYWY